MFPDQPNKKDATYNSKNNLFVSDTHIYLYYRTQSLSIVGPINLAR